jgi:nucleotide-binding universal stress UspA family protein
MTLRHLLVPLDLSDRNERVLSAASALATGAGARVTLLHVIHRVPGLPARELAGFYGDLRRKSERSLARAAARLARAGLRVRALVRLGDPATEIVRVADRLRVDLVVVGSHRVSPARPRSGFGTTSYKVALRCQRPILLVK